MFVYYLLLILAALIFASQFLVTKQYQRYKGTGFYSTLKLSFFARGKAFFETVRRENAS